MNILLISSAFSGLTQRFYTELHDAGYSVSVELHLGDIANLMEGVRLFNPELIICPFLTRKLPKEIYEHIKCLIVHPGIKGDRGPSSLDWAIQNGETEWGVTLLEAAEEMDAGPVWASRTFPLRRATKSSIFYREVTEAAIECLWEALTYFACPDFQPEPQNYSRADYKGRLLPAMKQQDRWINWQTDTSEKILRHIRAADGSPGVLDTLQGKAFFIFNAYPETILTGKPGDIIAMTDHAVCRATVDGAVWLCHLKRKTLEPTPNLKLPTDFFPDELSGKPEHGLSFKKLLSKPVKRLKIDYFVPGKQLACQEIWYELDQEAAYLYFALHNGAMSTRQLERLLGVYLHLCTLSIKAIVLMGGEECWSNGIHLTHIEAALNPKEESWLNINAMDNFILQIIQTLDKLTVSAVAGSAGAGGAILALAADQVFVREGVIFNPHYKNMGGLYGSEYWTYLLPKRVGMEKALSLTEQRLPISARQAWKIGLCDKILDKRQAVFTAQVKHWVKTTLNDANELRRLLQRKAEIRRRDEAITPLVNYRKSELIEMYANFYGSETYHAARREFVYKNAALKVTPDHIAHHRHGFPKKPKTPELSSDTGIWTV